MQARILHVHDLHAADAVYYSVQCQFSYDEADTSIHEHEDSSSKKINVGRPPEKQKTCIP